MDRPDAEPYQHALASIGRLVGDHSRAAMLYALLGGQARTAGELARVASIAPQTASGHLSRLVDGGLLALEVQGRHRYYRLIGGDVAHAIEALSSVTGAPAEPLPEPELTPFRCARMCYDHLAGRLGVGLADALVTRGVLTELPRTFALTPSGTDWLTSFGIDVEQARASRRKFAPTCLDTTERRRHVAGALGAALATRVLQLGWAIRVDGDRALRLSVAGRREFGRRFELSL